MTIFMEGNSLVEVQTESFFYTPKIEHIRSTRLYLCCMVPASIQTCYPLRKYDGLSTCDGLLSHVTLQMYIWLVGCIAFIGNIAVFTLHIKSIKTKKNPVPIFLIANLAISDFIVANYLLIIAIGDRFYSHYNFAVESEHWLRSIPCLLACFICCAASLMSVFMMLIISIDRYVCIVYPFSERKLTVKSAFLLVACCWLFSIIFVGIPVMYSVGADGDNRLHGYSSICMASNVSNPYFKWWITAFTLITIICWIITCILYGKMLSSIRQSSRNVRKSKSISKDKRIAIRLFLILVTDLISWIPYYIVFMHVLSTSHSVDMIALQFTIIFALPINSAVNPCLYVIHFRVNPLSIRLIELVVLFEGHSS
ncbi:uncharacterized protein TRIADDRAFT_62166 [Trichoplax adhaerens]|uniref:G-protein coupled receptors family 1 profile domain-containing protein n=1 Tax=Trichoplax adhaerens TaxID=10228 RepID=B3SD09_TRIAD|nr:hypothetical protein TRIADDRAFT_62166 [Trichoplax adhaerens]EDV19353.1 hypothetical protein TRIADDRAFT_62166 [Trichoplax adhaerens]|eukprot:XP_002118128.1 hypothetical protein TRIADDRAFT_62166 [Trichoplax adhaerens]